MPLSVYKILQNVAEVTVQWGPDTVKAKYCPGMVTERVFADIQVLSKMQDSEDVEAILSSFTSMNDALAYLIQSWDIYEDKEETIVFPLENDRLKELPLKLRAMILGAITEDIRGEAVTP